MIKLSVKGLGLTTSTLLITTLSVVLADYILMITASVLTTLLIADLLHYLIRRRELCSCSPDVAEVLQIRRPKDLSLDINCWGVRNVSKLPKWLKVVKTSTKPEGLNVEVRTDFKYSGKYELSCVEVVRSSRLGFFSEVVVVRSNISFKVIPKTLYWVVIALGILGIGTKIGLSKHDVSDVVDKLSHLRSEGGIYYLTREYVPGDSMRRVDWKATARVGELCVKEFKEPLGGSALLCLDLRCVGRYTCDAVASAALSTIIASQSGGLGGLYDIANNKLIPTANYEGMLTYTLSKVLEPPVVDELDLYEYITPQTLSELRTALSKLDVVIGKPTDPGRAVVNWDEAIIISALIHELGKVLDVVEVIRGRGGNAVLITPLKPWIDTEDLELAYRLYVSYSKSLEKLRSLGAKIVVWDSDVIEFG